MNRIELRKLSLEFRRVSSNFLNSTMDNADVNLSRFLKLVNETPLIKEVIEAKLDGEEYDFKECYGFHSDGWADFSPPEDEALHIKAQYDYLTYINDTEGVNVLSQAMRYSWSERKYNAMIQNFVDMAFKPLIDFINDQISMELIVSDEEAKTASGNTFIQNIETLHGSANQQGSGIINAYSTTNDVAAMVELIDKLLHALPDTENENEAVEDVRDDLEMAREQLQSDAPKKSRLKKALDGIKRFAKELPMEVAVSIAAGAITSADWTALIQQIELFVGRLG